MIRSRLAVIMAERNIRQDEMSAATGISKATLSNIANNKTTGLQYGTLETIAMYIGVTPQELLEFVPVKYEFEFDKDTPMQVEDLSSFLQQEEAQALSIHSGLTLKIFGNRLSVHKVPMNIFVETNKRELEAEHELITDEYNAVISLSTDDDEYYGELLDKLNPAFLGEFISDISAELMTRYKDILANYGISKPIIVSLDGNYDVTYQFVIK